MLDRKFAKAFGTLHFRRGRGSHISAEPVSVLKFRPSKEFPPTGASCVSVIPAEEKIFLSGRMIYPRKDAERITAGNVKMKSVFSPSLIHPPDAVSALRNDALPFLTRLRVIRVSPAFLHSRIAIADI